jgi:hypothetical protein
MDYQHLKYGYANSCTRLGNGLQQDLWYQMGSDGWLQRFFCISNCICLRNEYHPARLQQQQSPLNYTHFFIISWLDGDLKLLFISFFVFIKRTRLTTGESLIF